MIRWENARQYEREWAKQNPEKRRQYKKKYRASAKGKATERAYALKAQAVGKTALQGRKYRLKHPRKYKAIKQKYVAERREFANSLKRKPCTDCGNTFPPICMDWDHVRGKKVKDVTAMFDYSVLKLMAEIAKCDLVCANCHRLRTALRGNHRGVK